MEKVVEMESNTLAKVLMRISGLLGIVRCGFGVVSYDGREVG